MKFIKLKEQSKITPWLTTDCDKGMDEPLIKMQWERTKWILVFGSMKIACVFDLLIFREFLLNKLDNSEKHLSSISREEESEEDFDGI